MDKDAKEARNRRIFDLWLACWTQQEIADEVGLSQPQIKELCDSFIDIGKLAKTDKATAELCDPVKINGRTIYFSCSDRRFPPSFATRKTVSTY